ncbi:MAG: hypothetical protein J6A37_16355, partial [Oscillospiraceae bacterium]|nr:hypothetical protein [Oscillospiraceae bacterium]
KNCTNNHKVKVSVKPVQRLAGFQRAEPFGRCPQTAKPSYFREITEQGVRNATAFRGEANKTASPSNSSLQIHPSKRSGGTF